MYSHEIKVKFREITGTQKGFKNRGHWSHQTGGHLIQGKCVGEGGGCVGVTVTYDSKLLYTVGHFDCSTLCSSPKH